MSVKIITDSASDITQAEAALWGIDVLPLKTIFGEEEFLAMIGGEKTGEKEEKQPDVQLSLLDLLNNP